MKIGKGMKLASILLAALFALCALPQASLAELPDYLEVTLKEGFSGTIPSGPPHQLEKGEIWVNRTAASEAGKSPEATVTISALGREYTVTQEKPRKYNIVFVLDRSASMEGVKDDNMATAANAAIETLRASNAENKIGIVTFGTTAQLDRGLSTDPVTLTANGGQGINVKAYPDTSGGPGGTNIQAGLNVAYDALKGTDKDTTPVIILLSDGAPTFYYPSIDDVTLSGEPNGNGSSVTNLNIAMTVVQAAYLKAMLPGMQIHTIAFDITSSEAKATLNPIADNISSNLATELNNVKNAKDKKGNYTYITNDDIRENLVYSYADGWYEANKSTESLKEALDNIIESIKVNTPITESPKGENDPTLSDTSYVKITDTIGGVYMLSGGAAVKLGSASYPFSYDRSSNTFIYSGEPNAQIAKIVLTYNRSTRELVWKIPASVLPCVSADGTKTPAPIRLVYGIELDGDSINSDGTYSTSAGCNVWFTPTRDNPFYNYTTETKDGGTYNMVKSETEYYKVVFTGSGSNTEVLGFAKASSLSGPYTPVDVSGKKATFSNGTLTIGSDYTFTGAVERSITARFAARDRDSANSYNRTTSPISPVITIPGEAVSNAKVIRVSRGFLSSTCNLTVTYTVNGVACEQQFSAKMEGGFFGEYYEGDTSGTIRLITTDKPMTRRLYTYSASPEKLMLEIPGKSAVTLVEGKSGNVKTEITKTGDSYVATVTTDKGSGAYETVEYRLENDVLGITTTTRTLKENGTVQDYMIDAFGAMTVRSSNIITNVRLTSKNGAESTVGMPDGDTAGKYYAEVMLTFEANAKFVNMALSLGSAKGSEGHMPLTEYEVIGKSAGLTEKNGLYSAEKEGEYFLLIRFVNPYTNPIPDAFWVYAESIAYKTSSGSEKEVLPNEGYAGQKVRVVMSSPTKH